jgi:C4-dicarboxylate-specific signal transduction histidine kinase
MVEIYKEPADLVERIDAWIQGYLAGDNSGWRGDLPGVVLDRARAPSLLQSQQQQLVSNETFVALGEMSSAVAHSLRNPLATIRSSAELAQEVASQNAQRNIGDIISQVDRMSRWVRELLVSLRPMNDDGEAVDLLAGD